MSGDNLPCIMYFCFIDSQNPKPQKVFGSISHHVSAAETYVLIYIDQNQLLDKMQRMQRKA